VSDLRVPSATTALATMARLTFVRLSRGKLMWISMAIGLLPILYAAAGFDAKDPVGGVFVIEMVVLSVMAPLFVAPSIGEEIEDRTATYLWSRPLPRWTILAGKLLALAPVAMAITVVSWIGAIAIKTHELPPVATIVGLAGGALAISAISAAIAVLVPKQGMALAIIYMIVDGIVGLFPGSIRLISVTQAATAVGGINDTSATTGAIAMVVIAAVWFAVAFRRIGRLET
jgi:ABC-2 type transport system permease protein